MFLPQDDPRPTYNEIRKRGPVYRSKLGYSAVSSHELCARVLRRRLPDQIGPPDEPVDIISDFTAPLAALRAATALGILRSRKSGRFSLTAVGAQLRTDHPMSLYAVARVLTDPLLTRAWNQLSDSVQTGQTTFDDIHGTDFFSYLKGEPELSALFNAAMSQGSREAAAALPQHYDFSRFGTVMDIGGGDGTLLSVILSKNPELRGILFDTAEGAAQAGDTFREAGVAERCAVQTGDFFTAVPEGADLHLLKSIVHDWPDDQVVTILSHCRRVLPDDGRLLIIESVLPDTVDSNDPYAYLNDLNMLVNLGGRERTRADFEQLCGRSGFTLTTATPLVPYAMISCVEAVPA